MIEQRLDFFPLITFLHFADCFAPRTSTPIVCFLFNELLLLTLPPNKGKIPGVMLRTISALALVGGCSAVSVGDVLPNRALDFGFPPEKVPIRERVAGKNVRDLQYKRSCKNKMK